MHNKLNISLHPSDCPGENILREYYLGQLNKNEVRKIEEHLIDCEMCSDFLEGLSLLSGTEELDKEANAIITKINSSRTKKNRLWLYATAASVFLAISLFTIIWYMPTKNNFVSDKLVKQSLKANQQSHVNDLIKSPKLIDNPSDGAVTGDEDKSEKKAKVQNQQQVVSLVLEDAAEEAQKEQIVDQEYWHADNFKAGDVVNEKAEADQNIVDAKVVVAQGNTVELPIATEQSNEIVGGTKLASTSETGGKDRNIKSDKKSSPEEGKNSETKSVDDLSKLKEEAPAFSSTNQPVQRGLYDESEKQENNMDLDKAQVYLNQQMADSAIVYATKAITSCDSCKWIARLLLSKAYLVSGQKEKAILVLKDIKTNGPSEYSKKAKLELDKLK